MSDANEEEIARDDPGLPPGERGDNPEAPAPGGSEQGIADAGQSSGGSRGPSGGDPVIREEHA